MLAESFLRYNPLRNRNRTLRTKILGKENQFMPRRTIFATSLFLCLFGSPLSLHAQLPGKPNPLTPGQGGQGGVGCSATEASSCAEAAAKILPIVMGSSPMEENLRRLTDEIGGRVTGSPEMAKALEWGLGAFRAAGVDVHTEKYTLPVTWSEGKTRVVARVMPHPISHDSEETYYYSFLSMVPTLTLRSVSEAWGPPTPRKGIVGRVVDVGYGSQSEFAGAGSIRGAILLVHSDIGSTWADLFNEYLRPPDIIEHAVKEGARAILWMGARERQLLYRHTNSLAGEIDRIPQAVLAREDAMRLARIVA